MGCHYPNQGIYVPYVCLDGRFSRKFVPHKILNEMYRNGASSVEMDSFVSSMWPDSLGRGANSCKKCVICRLNYSKEWAIRCVHESQMYRENSFVTLTYHPDFLPEGGTLFYDDFQKFNKRLIKGLGPNRFFMCGEYGEKEGRPHYHALFFGLDFADKKYWRSEKGCPLFTSSMLDHFWQLGHTTVGSLTFQSAAYVSRYILKKVTGVDADAHYRGRVPEFCHMSNRRGIGHSFVEKFTDDVYVNDGCVIQSSPRAAPVLLKPPRYYDKYFKEKFPLDFEILSDERDRISKEREVDNTFARQQVKRKVFLAQNRDKLLLRDVV